MPNRRVTASSPPDAGEKQMMDFGLVASGAAIGIAVAAPIGPVNLIVIRRTLRLGQINGLLSGLGAACGDGVFASIAAFGLTAAIDFFMDYELVLQFIGAMFLLVLGVRTFFAHPHLQEEPREVQYSAVARIFVTTFALTVTNPATMLGFIAIFGGVAGLSAHGQGYGHAATLVGSVFLGSVLWWAGLSRFVGLFRNRMDDRLLVRVNRLSGALIATFGLVLLARVLVKYFG